MLSVYFLISIFALSISAQPSKMNPLKDIETEISKILIINNNSSLNKRELKEVPSLLHNVHSKYSKTINEEYVIIEHQIIQVLNDFVVEEEMNLAQTISIKVFDIYAELISNFCSIESKGNSSKKECKAINNIGYNSINLIYNFTIAKGDRLIINYKYKKIEIYKNFLFLSESIKIPEFNNTDFCDYKLILSLSENYINLGLQNNFLKKKSDTVYEFYGQCNGIIDAIRYSPKQCLFEAEIEIFLENTHIFKSDVNFSFPRYFEGGKLDINGYSLTSLDDKSFESDDFYILENFYYNITVPAKNKNKVGIKLRASFYNILKNDFKVNIPEKYYKIDLSKIDEEIIDKAYEITREDSDYPDYYKIGKFVNSYMNYDINMLGKKLTLKEIFKGRKGACEHITKLYNSMLNSIGIKTLCVSGIVLQKNKTSEFIPIFHSWTAAFINGKWIELDATFGLFEGIPTSYIFQNYGEREYYSSSDNNGGKTKLGSSTFIKIIYDNINDNEDKNNNVVVDIVIIIVCLIIFCCLPAPRNINDRQIYPHLVEEDINNWQNNLPNIQRTF